MYVPQKTSVSRRSNVSQVQAYNVHNERMGNSVHQKKKKRNKKDAITTTSKLFKILKIKENVYGCYYHMQDAVEGRTIQTDIHTCPDRPGYKRPEIEVI